MDVTLTVNGVTRAATGITPHTSLLHWLRREGLTGSKEGCAEGECGACAVLLSRPGEDGGTRLESVNGCLLPLAALNGQEVRTVEGLGTPAALHPVQEALAVRGGSQCGYCTPGQLCSSVGALDEIARGVPSHVTRNLDDVTFSAEELRERLSGNICRCAAYPNIIAAVSEVHTRQNGAAPQEGAQ